MKKLLITTALLASMTLCANAQGADDADIFEQAPAHAEQQRRAREEEARKPADMLATMYGQYILAKNCEEVRSGYAAVYLATGEIQRARRAVQIIERGLTARDPQIKSDERRAVGDR